MDEWARNDPGIDSKIHHIVINNTDWRVHRYSERNEKKREESSDIRSIIDHFMWVETKAFKAEMDFSQQDTFNVTNRLLRRMVGPRRIMKMADDRRHGKMRYVRCYGCHVLRCSGASPPTSEEMWWDGIPITLERLRELLRFEYDPDSPNKKMDMRRHHKQPAREKELSLFRMIK